MPDVPMCAARVWEGYFRRLCAKRATIETDGVWTCKTHSPAAIAARKAKSEEKYRAERDAAEARYRTQQMERESLPVVRDLVAWEGTFAGQIPASLGRIIDRAHAVLVKETK